MFNFFLCNEGNQKSKHLLGECQTEQIMIRVSSLHPILAFPLETMNIFDDSLRMVFERSLLHKKFNLRGSGTWMCCWFCLEGTGFIQ